MDRINALNVLVQVVDSGSFAAAGRKLGVSASAVGKSITRLEERVRARLVDRTSRSLRLTQEGQRFVERGRRILAELEDAEAELAESAAGPRGLLRVSMPVAGGPFHEVLAGFQAAHPAVDLEVHHTNRKVDLVREGFDVALRSGDLGDGTLKARLLGTFRVVLVASPDYLARRGTPRRPHDLAHHDLLQLRAPRTGRLHPLAFSRPEPSELVVRRTSLVADSLGVLIYFAEHGRGLAYVADVLVRDALARGKLTTVLADHVGESISMHLVWPPGRHMAPKLRVFVDYVAAHLFPR